MPNQSLTGKSALVTGATSGIGEATAYALADAGAQVLVVGRRRDLGEQVVSNIQKTGGSASFYAADMHSVHDINSMV